MKNNFEENIMNQIRSGKVKLRSRYLFLVEKVGTVGGFIFSLFFSIFLINLVLYYLKATGSLEYLSFGSSGVLAFLESFPSILLILGIIFTFATGYFMAKNDISYKQPFVYMVFGLIVLIIFSSSVLASTGFNEKLEEVSQAENAASSVLRPFFNREIDSRDFGIIGRIIKIEKESIVLRTINDTVLLVPDKVKKNAVEDFSKLNAEYGDFVTAVGKMIEGEFKVLNIKKIDKNKIPLIRNRLLHVQIKEKCDVDKNGFIDRQERIKCNAIVDDIKNKCGDGICDSRERNNKILCPQDCVNN